MKTPVNFLHGRAFLRALITGCSIHYDRAILKKVKALHLTPIIRQNNDAKLFLKKIMALAYLPATKIPNEYATLKNVIETYNSILKDQMGQHPSAWDFIGKIIKLTSKARNDVESLKSNKRIRRQPRYSTIFRRRELTNANLKGHIDQVLMRLPEENSEDEVPLEERPEVMVTGKSSNNSMTNCIKNIRGSKLFKVIQDQKVT
ncbi:uncharacterized protein [Venturia canescens]|uniref:uncharacterized protein n=1 Tax=Venturia canescens TaxID=32260 RepID=UPI001C9C7AD6|nr:uncharacterized protein LOC122417773 [Venturia canescens]